MRFWSGWGATILALLSLVVVLENQGVIDSSVGSVLNGVVVLTAGIGTKLLADRRRAAARQDADDGIEVELARRAAAATLPVALIAIALLALWSTVHAEWGLAALCYLAAAVTVVAHWVIYAHLRRRRV